jgi:SNF2 family DNA or RNA helicase
MLLPSGKYKTHPYRHQIECLNKFGRSFFFALLAEMGTGKSKIIIDNIADLWSESEVDGAIVFAPNGVHTNWTNIELPKHMPDHVRWRSAAWKATQNKTTKAKLEALFESPDSSELRVLTMNWEALQTEKGLAFALRFCMACNKLMIVGDESTMIKSPSAQRTKALLRKLKKHARYRRIMNGTPVSNSPFDLFSQFMFLDEEILETTSYYAFKAEYAEMLPPEHGLLQHIIKDKTKMSAGDRETISENAIRVQSILLKNGREELIGGAANLVSACECGNYDSLPSINQSLREAFSDAPSRNKTLCLQAMAVIDNKVAAHTRLVSAKMDPRRLPQIIQRDKDGKPRFRNLDKLEKLIAPHSFRVLKSECLDLPKKIYKTIFYDLTTAQRKAYDLMKEESRMMLLNQALPVANKLVALSKLAQIASGYYLPPGSKEPVRIEGGSPKIELLAETVERVVKEQEKKVIVWARFHVELDDIYAALKKAGLNCVRYDGRRSTDEREQAKEDFQNGDAQVFIGQQQSGGVGITLTAASVVCYFSNTFSLYDRLQSEDRAHRIGQEEDVVYLDFVAENSIEEKTLAVLRNKKSIADIITGDKVLELL